MSSRKLAVASCSYSCFSKLARGGAGLSPTQWFFTRTPPKLPGHFGAVLEVDGHMNLSFRSPPFGLKFLCSKVPLLIRKHLEKKNKWKNDTGLLQDIAGHVKTHQNDPAKYVSRYVSVFPPKTGVLPAIWGWRDGSYPSTPGGFAPGSGPGQRCAGPILWRQIWGHLPFLKHFEMKMVKMEILFIDVYSIIMI